MPSSKSSSNTFFSLSSLQTPSVLHQVSTPSLLQKVFETFTLSSGLLTSSLIHQTSAKKTHYLATLKLIPQWVSLLLLKSGLGNMLSPVFRLSGTSATELVSSLTNNKDLHVIFSYLFYGKGKARAIDVSQSGGGEH